MSLYSADSLEDIREIPPCIQDLRENNDDSNLLPDRISTKLSSNTSFYLKPTAAVLARRRDTGSNETAPSTDKVTGTVGVRNAIIASRGIADASKRRRPASSRSRKRDVMDRLERNNGSTRQKSSSVAKGVVSSRLKRSTKTFPAKRSCCSKENSMPMKPDKKLGNVLGPNVQQARNPRSYLELYRRRFSVGPPCDTRSPEGSTLSVCGDSQREQLTDDDTCLLATPRDDRSELSFYRRLIEGSTDPTATTTRSSETVHQHVSEDTNQPRLGRVKRNGDKSNSLGYRPYTIEEYRTLSIPKLDRSLGPDKVEMQAKREWLTRRRSYGNSVSARNRQRILLQAQKLESKHGAAEECFLPPLKDQEVDAKTQCNSVSSTTSEDQGITQKNGNENCNKYFKKNVDVCRILSSRKLKKLERTSSFSSSLNSYDIIEDSYVESLRQRHLYEKEMVDRIINQALYP